MTDDAEPTTEQLRAVQRAKADEEAGMAREATDVEEQRAHQRRAEKAGYLEERLDEQAKSQDAAEHEDESA